MQPILLQMDICVSQDTATTVKMLARENPSQVTS